MYQSLSLKEQLLKSGLVGRTKKFERNTGNKYSQRSSDVEPKKNQKTNNPKPKLEVRERYAEPFSPYCEEEGEKNTDEDFFSEFVELVNRDLVEEKYRRIVKNPSRFFSWSVSAKKQGRPYVWLLCRDGKGVGKVTEKDCNCLAQCLVEVVSSFDSLPDAKRYLRSIAFNVENIDGISVSLHPHSLVSSSIGSEQEDAVVVSSSSSYSESSEKKLPVSWIKEYLEELKIERTVPQSVRFLIQSNSNTNVVVKEKSEVLSDEISDKLYWYRIEENEVTSKWLLQHEGKTLGSIVSKSGAYEIQCFIEIRASFKYWSEAQEFLCGITLRAENGGRKTEQTVQQSMEGKPHILGKSLVSQSVTNPPPSVSPRPQAVCPSVAPSEPDFSWVADYLRDVWVEFGLNPRLNQFDSKDVSYKLTTTEQEGIDSRFDYEGVSPHEVTMGIDFGTSTAKVVFHDPSDGESGRVGEAVPFLDASGIDAYLLPTELWLDAGVYTLAPSVSGTCYSTIKLAFMAKDSSEEQSFRFVAFLALLIRHARSWYFKRYPLKESIQWNVVLGCPSSIEQENYLEKWKKALLKAWILADKDGPITYSDYLNRKELELALKEIKDIEPYFSAISEVQAEAYAFIEDYPRQRKNEYVIVDIGSSTVDIASFGMTKSPESHAVFFFMHKCEVQELGTTKIHHRRLNNFWKEVLKISKKKAKQQEPYDKLLSEVEIETSKSLQCPLPETGEWYFSDLTLSNRENYKRYEGHIQPEIESQLSRIVEVAEPNIPIILCGGGSRSKYYCNIYEKAYGRRLVRLEPIRNLRVSIPILKEDYDRLLVAYGLATIHFGRKQKENPSQDDVVATDGYWKESTDWEDRFIGKELV